LSGYRVSNQKSRINAISKRIFLIKGMRMKTNSRMNKKTSNKKSFIN